MAGPLSASYRRSLEKLLREVQRAWRLENWQIDICWVDSIPPTDGAGEVVGQVQWDLPHRAAAIQLPYSIEANDGDAMPSPRNTVVHELAHVLLVELGVCFKRAADQLAPAQAEELRVRWHSALEVACNSLASGYLNERPQIMRPGHEPVGWTLKEVETASTKAAVPATPSRRP